MTAYTQGERIAALEVATLAQNVEIKDLKDEVKELTRKIESLLELRWKGAGAFWLAAALLGTGIVGVVAQFFHYIGVRP